MLTSVVGVERREGRGGIPPIWFVEWWFVNDEAWVTIGSIHDQALPDGPAEAVQQVAELALWEWWNVDTTLPEGRYRVIVADSPKPLPMGGVYEATLGGRTYNMVEEYNKRKKLLQRERAGSGLR
jgi:hypothetical protein